jgi:hypothetical protein
MTEPLIEILASIAAAARINSSDATRASCRARRDPGLRSTPGGRGRFSRSPLVVLVVEPAVRVGKPFRLGPLVP